MVYCDSQSAIDLRKNATYHSKTKHIEVKYHWIRDPIKLKRFQLKKINTGKNAADMMMKTVPRQKLEFCSKLAGMGSHKGSKVTSTFSHIHGFGRGDLMESTLPMVSPTFLPTCNTQPTYIPTCLSFAYKLKANALRFIILSFGEGRRRRGRD